MLGPLLFSVYCAGLSELFLKHIIRYHVYADETQLYVDFPRGDSASAADRIRRCVIDVKAWLASRCLLLNETKTEAMLFAGPNNRIPQPPPLCSSVWYYATLLHRLEMYLFYVCVRVMTAESAD